MTKKTLLSLWCVLMLALITAFSLCAYAAAPNLNNHAPAQVGPRIHQNIDESVYVPMSGNTRPEATAVNYRGPASPGLQMDHIFLFLQRSPQQEQALNQLIEQLNDRKSPKFHKWMTAEQFGQQFGVAQSDIDTITGWLQSHGLRVNKVYTNQMVIDFSGTAGQVGAGLPHPDRAAPGRRRVTYRQHERSDDSGIAVARSGGNFLPQRFQAPRHEPADIEVHLLRLHPWRCFPNRTGYLLRDDAAGHPDRL